MASVTVLPAGLLFEASVDQTLMGAAMAHGLYWPTTCGGQGVCTTCLSEVTQGCELLAEMGRSERRTLVHERGEAILGRPLRLACQAVVMRDGTLTVVKSGVHSA